jgi:ElaB/YqjD/DUF883 family membrane-anchored ribosome-binding protein
MNSINPSAADTGDSLRRTNDPSVIPKEEGTRQWSTPSQDALGRGMAQVQSAAGPAMQEAAHGALSFLQDSALDLRRRAALAGEAGTGYVRANPLLAVVVAAGAGALLATLVRALVRAR